MEKCVSWILWQWWQWWWWWWLWLWWTNRNDRLDSHNMHPKCWMLVRHSDLFITFHDQGMTWPTPGWASFYTFTVICYLPPRLILHPAFFASSTIAGFSIFPPCNPAELLEPTHARAWALITKDCLDSLKQLLLFLFSLYSACHSTSFCKVWLATDCWVNSWVNFLRDSDYPGHRGKLFLKERPWYHQILSSAPCIGIRIFQ